MSKTRPADLYFATHGCQYLFDNLIRKKFVFEKLLEIIPTYYFTTGENVFVSVCEILKKFDLPLSMLSFVVTDGAPSMTSKNIGLVER